MSKRSPRLSAALSVAVLLAAGCGDAVSDSTPASTVPELVETIAPTSSATPAVVIPGADELLVASQVDDCTPEQIAERNNPEEVGEFAGLSDSLYTATYWLELTERIPPALPVAGEPAFSTLEFPVDAIVTEVATFEPGPERERVPSAGDTLFFLTHDVERLRRFVPADGESILLSAEFVEGRDVWSVRLMFAVDSDESVYAVGLCHVDFTDLAASHAARAGQGATTKAFLLSATYELISELEYGPETEPPDYDLSPGRVGAADAVMNMLVEVNDETPIGSVCAMQGDAGSCLSLQAGGSDDFELPLLFDSIGPEVDVYFSVGDGSRATAEPGVVTFAIGDVVERADYRVSVDADGRLTVIREPKPLGPIPSDESWGHVTQAVDPLGGCSPENYPGYPEHPGEIEWSPWSETLRRWDAWAIMRAAPTFVSDGMDFDLGFEIVVDLPSDTDYVAPQSGLDDAQVVIDIAALASEYGTTPDRVLVEQTIRHRVELLELADGDMLVMGLKFETFEPTYWFGGPLYVLRVDGSVDVVGDCGSVTATRLRQFHLELVDAGFTVSISDLLLSLGATEIAALEVAVQTG